MEDRILIILLKILLVVLPFQGLHDFCDHGVVNHVSEVYVVVPAEYFDMRQFRMHLLQGEVLNSDVVGTAQVVLQ